MVNFTRLILLSSLLLPLVSCNDSNTGVALPDPASNSIPRDEGQTMPPVAAPTPKVPEVGTGGGNKGGAPGPGRGSGSGSNGSGGGSGGGSPPSGPVPEPGTLFLVGAGLALVATRRRRRAEVNDSATEETTE